YFVTYANNYGWEFDAKANASENLLDKWILARLKETVQMTTDSLEKFEAYKATSVLENFLNDLSNWYIRRSRGRVTDPDTDDLNRSDFFQTTYIVLHTLSLVLAPFIPFMSEVIY